MKQIKTVCAGCGKILTDENGKRLCSANFDSSLPTPAPTKDKTFAWCDECKKKKGKP